MTLPEGWRRETLGQIAEGGLFSDGDWVESKDQDPAGEVRLTQLADIGVGEWRDRSDRWLREDQASRLRCTFLRPRDVLIARMPDPLGRACLVPEGIGRAVTVVDVAVLRITRLDVDPHFLMWALNAPSTRADIESMQSGTTRKRVSRKNLATVPIALPAVDEQHRIVEILEEHLSNLDAAATAIRSASLRSTALIEEQAAARLTGQVRLPAEWRAAYSADAEPLLPFGWRWAKLGAFADVVGGVTKDAKKQADTALPEVPYLRVANVQRGRLDLDRVGTIRVAPERARALALQGGDVLLNEGGDRNKLARGWVWESQIEHCIHQNHVFRARVDRSIVEPQWVSRVANTLGAHWAELHGKQSVNLASISLSTIRQMPVPLPPLATQQELLDAMHDAEVVDGRLQRACAAGLARGAALRRALLQAAFSGQLTGRSSDLDRAEESVAS